MAASRRREGEPMLTFVQPYLNAEHDILHLGPVISPDALGYATRWFVDPSGTRHLQRRLSAPDSYRSSGWSAFGGRATFGCVAVDGAAAR